MADPAAETEALVRRYYAAFDAGDIDGMLACLDPDIRHDVNQGGTRIGRDAFRDFCRHMARCYRERLADLVVMVTPDGRRAAAEFTVHGTYLATDPGLPEARGQPYVLPAGAFLAIAHGRITRVTTHYNLKDWIAQVSA